ncbi:DUF1801 domain-containing protein [Flavicella sediminum]|uniref:DUF1801 domain-containing protein n=1 Tax=Flavicella sediminum TaxID=2585141 RepID=UPI00111DA0E6|nr:DUF1801 domain-containing protein [Flavicella sediminum]
MKTIPNKLNVLAFLENIEHEKIKIDAFKILALMEKWTEYKAVMWGPSIIGFGSYHYKYDSGREGDSMLVGFSPRKTNLTLYIMCGFKPNEELMQQLGTYKTGKSCLYLKKLEDIDLTILEKLVKNTLKHMLDKHS